MKSSEMGHNSIKATFRARTNALNNVNASNAAMNAKLSSLTQQFPPGNINMLHCFLIIIWYYLSLGPASPCWNTQVQHVLFPKWWFITRPWNGSWNSTFGHVCSLRYLKYHPRKSPKCQIVGWVRTSIGWLNFSPKKSARKLSSAVITEEMPQLSDPCFWG